MSFLTRVCAALSKAKLPYAIVGGHAVALHGAVRGTVDLDIAVKWDFATLLKTEQVLSAIDLQSRLPITAEEVFNFRDEYIKNRNLKAWSFYNPNDLSEQVDIIIVYDLHGKRTINKKVNQQTITVLHIEDLIEMKKQSGRPQDLEDVKALEHIK